MSDTVSVRVPKEDLDEIASIQKLEKKAKSSVMREIMELGIKEKKLEIALEKFRKNEATAAKAARMAGIPLTAFLDLLKKEGLEFHFTKEDVEAEFEGLL